MDNIQESYVSLDTALLAMLKGFSLYTETRYDKNGEVLYYPECQCLPEDDFCQCSWVEDYEEYNNGILRPSNGLLQKWLREVHKIDIYIIGYGFGYYSQLNNVPPANQGNVKYIDRRWNMPPEEENSGQRTYEEAQEIAFKQALNLL